MLILSLSFPHCTITPARYSMDTTTLYGVFEPSEHGETTPNTGTLVGLYVERKAAHSHARFDTTNRYNRGGPFPYVKTSVYRVPIAPWVSLARSSYDHRAGYYLVRADFDLRKAIG